MKRPSFPNRHFPKAGLQRFTSETVLYRRGGNEQPTPTGNAQDRDRGVSDSFRIFHTSFELTALPGQQISRHETPEEAEWSPLAMEAVQLPA